jgi:imidazolonepropionase-like amidohydrolase
VRAGADSIEHATGIDDATIAEMVRAFCSIAYRHS